MDTTASNMLLQNLLGSYLRDRGLSENTLQRKGDVIADEVSVVLDKYTKMTQSTFAFLHRIRVVVSDPQSPREFFNPRFGKPEGLWIDDQVKKIVSDTKKCEAGSVYSMSLYQAEGSGGATDEEMEGSLGPLRMLDEIAACALLIKLISRQRNGKSGILLNTGHPNLFFTSQNALGVFWRKEVHQWRILSWERDKIRWQGDKTTHKRRLFMLAE
ncbi:hypothetical protein A2837_02610 [Candidatus Kaiserbacteria bacterium RIFCSPHIGHO2_01_FULL_46_22]|uniref:Uncharacterized protein n=1 Tax=Candidatus Kaiserbacteria bacterium RIFCSPHIGHO2_01_FULL_46_22 TaxID=1798475 RepID=A0A1F6BX34_9BACT|nr:MAG: hypothetical protein A2837_02610 [Candidatus Kaiserbacteria bacterium RIFCSPHIGHO2_01_FULL_46_22]